MGLIAYVAGDQLRPSELQRTLQMRLQNLKAAVARSSHDVQVLFVVNGPAEKDLVNSVLSGSSKTKCNQVSGEPVSVLPNTPFLFILSKP